MKILTAHATAKNVVDYIKEVVTAGAYDDKQIKADIAANKGAIDTLNGTGDGSVKKAVSDAVAKIVAEAPEAYDTLKEISDWITNHTSDAATMNSQINTNKTDIANLKTLIGTLPDTATSKDIVSYIAEYVSKALADSDLSQYATAEALKRLLLILQIQQVVHKDFQAELLLLHGVIKQELLLQIGILLMVVILHFVTIAVN